MSVSEKITAYFGGNFLMKILFRNILRENVARNTTFIFQNDIKVYALLLTSILIYQGSGSPRICLDLSYFLGWYLGIKHKFAKY